MRNRVAPFLGGLPSRHPVGRTHRARPGSPIGQVDHDASRSYSAITHTPLDPGDLGQRPRDLPSASRLRLASQGAVLTMLRGRGTSGSHLPPRNGATRLRLRWRTVSARRSGSRGESACCGAGAAPAEAAPLRSARRIDRGLEDLLDSGLADGRAKPPDLRGITRQLRLVVRPAAEVLPDRVPLQRSTTASSRRLNACFRYRSEAIRRIGSRGRPAGLTPAPASSSVGPNRPRPPIPRLCGTRAPGSAQGSSPARPTGSGQPAPPADGAGRSSDRAVRERNRLWPSGAPETPRFGIDSIIIRAFWRSPIARSASIKVDRRALQRRLPRRLQSYLH